MSEKPEKVTAILACEGDLVQTPESSEGNLKLYPEGGPSSVAYEVDLAKSD